MHEIGAFEAKNRLGALLDRVERGEEIVITRRGRPVAKLVPAGPSFDRESARRAVAGLLEASRGVTLGGLKIKDLIDEGRGVLLVTHDVRLAQFADRVIEIDDGQIVADGTAQDFYEREARAALPGAEWRA